MCENNNFTLHLKNKMKFTALRKNQRFMIDTYKYTKILLLKGTSFDL